MNILGIDPGEHGGYALMTDANFPTAIEFSKQTKKEVSDIIKFYADCMGPLHCIIEKVHAAPRQGVTSTFTFGKNYGFWLGLLTAHGIPYEEVPPQTWQGGLGIKAPRQATYADRKRLLKQRAEQLYPNVPIKADTADAVLIAEYGRRLLNSRK